MFGNPLKSVQKRLSKSFQRAGEIISGIGPLPIKQLRDAIIEGDEEKAITIFSTTFNSKSTEEFGPNIPISTRKQNGVTSMHIAAQFSLIRVIELFLKHQGNPNQLTARMETCLHFLFSQSDVPEKRLEMLNMFLEWCDEEGSISVNRVDVDGNAAIHKAASNGLIDCVARLIAAGAIISIVNKSQLTCCEAADENGYKALASMLELALMFQPEDADMESFVLMQRFANESQSPILLPECRTLRLEEVASFITATVRSAMAAMKDDNLTPSRIEAMLDKYSWDVHRLKTEYIADPATVFKTSQLSEVLIPYPKFDVGPWVDPSEDVVGSKEATETAVEKPAVAAQISDVSTSLPGVVPTLEAVVSLSAQVSPLVAVEEGEDGGLCLNDIDIGDLAPSAQLPEEVSGSLSVDVQVKPVSGAEVETVEAGQGPSKLEDSPVPVPVPVTADEEENTILVKLLCPHIRLRIRPTPSTLEKELGYAESGSEYLVYKETVNGFYKLVGDGGYIVKSVTGVFWEEVGAGTREFVPESCPICCEDMHPPVPPALLKASSSNLSPPASGATAGTSASACGSAESAVPHRDLRAVYCASGHGFCLGCWSTYVSTQVRDEGAYSLKCPGYKCGEILSDEWAPVLLQGSGLEERWASQRLRHVVDCCKSLRWCPHEGCESIVHIDDSETRLPMQTTGDKSVDVFVQSAICAEGHTFCLSCSSEAHSPCSCADWKKWELRVKQEISAAGQSTDSASGAKPEDIANAMWVAANTKKCPRCSTPIEKDEGCNHMSCRKCRYEFCWICMQDWTLHNSNTGGYFQCNRFLGGESADGSDPVAEVGSAQSEGHRMRKQGQKMARFIHHFTRYQAHGDSQRMEKRMHRDTIGRIVSSLVKSAQGDLKWLLPEVSNPFHPDSGVSSKVISAVLSAFGDTSQTVVSDPSAVGVSSGRKAAASASASASAGSTTPSGTHKKNSRVSSILSALARSHDTPGRRAAGKASAEAQVVASPAATVAADPDAQDIGQGLRLECITFLNKGFDELIKCRLVPLLI